MSGYNSFMQYLIPPHGPRSSLALLVLRIVTGWAFILHGSMKLGDPMHWASQALPGAPGWLQMIVVLAEFGGGFLLVVGLFTPLVAFLLACDMTVAIFAVHIPKGGHFVGGPLAFELPLLYLCLMLAFLLTGPGSYSIDAQIAARFARLPRQTSQPKLFEKAA